MILEMIRSKKVGTTGLYETCDNRIKLLQELSLEGRNVFFGYYDLQQMNDKQDRLLVHICDRTN